jgi:glucokinase
MGVIGLDVGGTKTAGILWSDGKVAARVRRDTDASSTETVLEVIFSACRQLMEMAPSKGIAVEAIGLGIAGFIDLEEGIITEAPNLPFHNLPIKKLLEGEFSLPIAVDNDANVAALAEARIGAARGMRNVIHLTLGTGIGGGILIDGMIYHGARGAAAELGHMIIRADGPRCNCGARGCLEALASGVALARKVHELAESGVSSPMLEEYKKSPGSFPASRIAEHARRGDGVARSLLEEAGHYLGVGIASLVNIFNPEAVTLSGGLLGAFSFLEGPMRSAVEENAIALSRRCARILLGTLGEDAGCLGAALLAESYTGPKR